MLPKPWPDSEKSLNTCYIRFLSCLDWCSLLISSKYFIISSTGFSFSNSLVSLSLHSSANSSILLSFFSALSKSALLEAIGSYEVSNSLAKSFIFPFDSVYFPVSLFSEMVFSAIFDADSSCFKMGLISSSCFWLKVCTALM